MARLNLTRGASDNAGVDQVSRPMQIALVAVVLLAGMWFTVLRPKPATESASPAPVASQPVAPGVKGLATAVDKAKGAAATSDAANAKVQAATGGTTAAKPSVTKSATATKSAPAKHATKSAPAHAAKPAAATSSDPSQALLDILATGKTVVLLFHGDGADDHAARRAVHRVALKDKAHVVSAYADISKVGAYQAITSGIDITTAPTILVIGTDKKASVLTGYVDAGVIEQAVGDARRSAGQAK